MKKLYTLFLAFFTSICILNAQNNIAVDAADNWTGYMNVFDMSNAYQFGSGWGVSDLKTTLDLTANNITLQPNFNTYADNPGDPYWQNGAIGNKLMEASTYVEPGATFNGTDLTFSGEVVSNTLDAALYTAKYFIKALDPAAGYSDALGGSATFDLPLSGSFSVTVPAASLTSGLIIQYGFMVNGINANPADEAALGSVVVSAAAPPPSGPACDHTFRMLDSYGDGWNGFGSPLTCAVDIIVDGSTVATGVGLGFTAGNSADEIFSASTGSVITLANWGVGAYDSEVSWEIIDGDGNVVATGVHGDTPNTTGACPPPPTCDHTFRMIDSYGDGWNGFGSPLTCAVDILVDGTPVATGVGLSFTAGNTADEIFSASSGSVITLDNWGVGAYDSEVSWEILDGGGAIIASGVHGDLTGGTGNCPSCLPPTALTASNITGSGADLSWTAGGTETQWNIEYGASGFTQGSGTSLSAVTTNPNSLTGLTSSTSYDFYVQADCGGVSSTWAGPYSFSTSFVCPPNAECATYNDTTSTDFDFTSIPGASNCPSTLTVNIPTGYVIDSVSTFYDMSAVGGGWMSEQVSWVNCSTNGVGEGSVYTGTGNSTRTLNYSRSGLTFANLASGAVDFELHAGRTYGGSGCDNSTFNRVEPGWTIIAYYGLPPSCSPPSALTASNLSASSADLSWTVNGTETVWNIEYDISGYTQGTGTAVNGVNTNPYTLSGLNSNTSYDYYIQADCGGGVTSTWVGPYTFTTPCGVLVAPYCQNFDALTPNDIGLGGCQTGDNISDCWTNDPSNTNNWVARSVSTSSTATQSIIAIRD